MTPKAEQLTEQMGTYTLLGLLVSNALQALIYEPVDACEEWRRVFFTVIGEGGTSVRWTTRLALSSMIQWTISPF